MSQLIDLCGKAIRVEDIKKFEKGFRKYVFCPVFEQVISFYETKSVFGKVKDTIRTQSFRFVGSYPYGAVLSDQEKPVQNDRYVIRTDGVFIASKVLDTIKAPLGNAVRMVQNNLGLDRSANMNIRIWTRGQTLAITNGATFQQKSNLLMAV